MRTRPERTMYRASPRSFWAKMRSFSDSFCSLSSRPILFSSSSVRSANRSIERSKSRTRAPIVRSPLARALAPQQGQQTTGRFRRRRLGLSGTWVSVQQTQAAFAARLGFGGDNGSGQLLDCLGERRPRAAAHQWLGFGSRLVGGLASMWDLVLHLLLERRLELLAGERHERLMIVEHEAQSAVVEMNDLAEDAQAFADIAQRVQLGRADHDDLLGHLERGNGRLVEAAAAVDDGGAELALHCRERGTNVRGGDGLALFGAGPCDEELQTTAVAGEVAAEGAPIEVAQALRRDSRERRFRSHPQQ